jgi:hypothetical protein
MDQPPNAHHDIEQQAQTVPPDTLPPAENGTGPLTTTEDQDDKKFQLATQQLETDEHKFSYNPALQLREPARKVHRKRGSNKNLTKFSSIPDARTLLQDNDGEMEN